jgi:GNAT superfamily N-acetyltransferase
VEGHVAGLHPLRRGGCQLRVREVSCPFELGQLLRLRHLVYVDQGYFGASSSIIDIDSYDRHSRFVGAYYRGVDGIERMIGGARMVLAEGEPNGPALDELLKQAAHPVPVPRRCTYPAQELMNFDDVVSWSAESGRHLVEFGRLVVRPDLQRSHFGARLVHAIYGLALTNGIDLGLALIPSRLLGFYVRRGCRLLEGRGSVRYMHHEMVPIAADLRALGNTLGDSQRESRAAAEAMRTSGCWTIPVQSLPDFA